MARFLIFSLLVLAFFTGAPTPAASRVTRPGLSKNWFGTLTKRAADDNSCVGRCGVLDTTKPCQCNDSCESFGDCCDDYEAVCNGLSCSGKCNADYDPADPCHCNDLCDQYNNCCPDYYDLCDGNSGVSDAALAAISEELLAMDNDNNIASFVSVNLQAKSRQDGSDPAPQPLMTVDPAAYDKPTVAKLIKMHDNFVPEVGVSEEISAAEQTEVNEFLDALLSTPIMIRTAEFLAETGYIPNNFRETFELIWFGLYSRSSGKLGSSGFEHVFLGELKSGVSGFHHWAYWAREEANGNLNYKGYIEQQNFGSKGMALSESFEWLNEDKSISSMFIGPSPELEMAIYTICFYARRNAQCPIVFNGQAVDVQTYDITYNGQQYVATAYAV